MQPQIAEVLRRYPCIIGQWTWTEPASGFSGARVFKIETAGGQWCLKAWPPGRINTERLAYVQQLQQLAADEWFFVPRIAATSAGRTWVQWGDWLWELSSWKPGEAALQFRPEPDSRSDPSGRFQECYDRYRRSFVDSLHAAVVAIGKVHAVWRPAQPRQGPCPALLRCCERLAKWPIEREEVAKHSDFIAQHPLRKHLHELPKVIDAAQPAVRADLLPHQATPVPIQPVLRDVWSEHVLFTHDGVSGLVDFGGVNEDSVAADLARFLGSVLANDAALLHEALDVYAERFPLTAAERQLVPLLDQAGQLVGIMNWLRWLVLEQRQHRDWGQVLKRVSWLRERVLQLKNSHG